MDDVPARAIRSDAAERLGRSIGEMDRRPVLGVPWPRRIKD